MSSIRYAPTQDGGDIGLPASQRLQHLARRLPQPRVAVGDLVDRLGTNGPVLAMVLFAAVTLIPGIAPFFGLGLCLVGLNLALAGNRLWLPAWLRRKQVSSAALAHGIARTVPRLQAIERLMRQRRAALLRGVFLRLSGLASLVNGILVVLPIPFGNTAPAVATLVLALALSSRDGTMVLVGIAATLLATILDLGLVLLGYHAVLGVVGLF